MAACWLFLVAACSLTTGDSGQAEVIFITATPQPILQADDGAVVPTQAPMVVTPTPPQNPSIAIVPTADPPRNASELADAPREHVVRSGDTLFGIANAYGLSLDSILSVNTLENPDALIVGQVIQLPGLPSQQTPSNKILPDSRFVRAPGADGFDIAGFINEQPGYIRQATDEVSTRQADGSIVDDILNAAQIVERVSVEYSVDPRLLLALLEYRAGWLSNATPDEALQTHPMISEEDSLGVDREGMYRQLIWTADRLNRGYYGWKYYGWTTLEFADGGERLLYDPGLNAATVGVQYFFSLNNGFARWSQAITEQGFYGLYINYFGDPFVGAIEPLVPPNLTQPELSLPFGPGETWFYTGGWHGGWGSGSAWAAVDFAPPDERQDGIACYTSEFFVRAVAPGVIVRSGGGVVVLDLDGDGDELTGWTILYLHIATQDRIEAGTTVQTGDPIGRAACEGGFSTATHLHIARRYNGEWITADCSRCNAQDMRPDFNMGGWSVVGIFNQEYQGYLDNGVERRTAEQGRTTLVNRVSW